MPDPAKLQQYNLRARHLTLKCAHARPKKGRWMPKMTGAIVFRIGGHRFSCNFAQVVKIPYLCVDAPASKTKNDYTFPF